MKSGAALFILTAVRMLSVWAGVGGRRCPHSRQFQPLRSRLIAASALLLGVYGAGATPVLAAPVMADDKWRIVCLHDALSDGAIVFRITPVGGEPLELTVPIKAGTRENDVARQVRNVFLAILSKELYHVETDDGEAVLVKKKMGKPLFRLEFLSNSVNGIGIRVELD